MIGASVSTIEKSSDSARTSLRERYGVYDGVDPGSFDDALPDHVVAARWKQQALDVRRQVRALWAPDKCFDKAPARLVREQRIAHRQNSLAARCADDNGEPAFERLNRCSLEAR